MSHYKESICILATFRYFSADVNRYQKRETINILPSFWYHSLIYSIMQCFAQTNDLMLFLCICQVFTFFITLGHDLLGETMELIN